MASLTDIRASLTSLVQAPAIGLKMEPEVPAITTNGAIIMRPAVPASDFEQAYQRGLDRWDFDLIIVIGGGDTTLMQRRLDAYIDGGGDQSIRKLVFDNRELGFTDGTKAHISGVVSYGPRDDAGYQHVAATLRLTVYTKPA